VTTVQVGSQVSGNISWLGADFNHIVHKGQVIARLDPSLFEAQLQQSNANLTQSRANHAKAQSDLERTKVQLLDTQQKYARAKELSAKNLIPQSDLDAAKIAVDSAQASLNSQQATVNQTLAGVTQSEASVNQSKVNLEHTIITAPIDGIVTSRAVDVGQTVAASMNAPTLFILAADLTKMQVTANIDESDVGRIRPGQRTTFRVDAYPAENFVGTVVQVRLQPQVIQNVTTYATVINVPNNDLKLKPGMTANVKVEIARRSDVLRVPNAALRFRPTTEIFAALNQQPPPEAQFAGGRGNRAGRGGQGANARQNAGGGQAAPASPAPSGAPSASTQQGPATGGGRSMGGSTAPGGRGAGGSGEGGSWRNRGEGGGQGGGSGRGGGGGRGGDPNNPEFRARMMDRFKNMSADEQAQFIERMKSRGQDTTEFEKLLPKKNAGASKASDAMQSKYGQQSAETIDALFAPLPTVETSGRVWLYMDKQLKPVNLRLGISDGTQTELLSGELQPGMEAVTGVIVGSVRTTPTGPAQGNPLMPGRGGPGGFGGGGRGGR
jgi:HlyD family secretion protein